MGGSEPTGKEGRGEIKALQDAAPLAFSYGYSRGISVEL